MKHHDPAAIRRAKIIRTIVMVFLCVLSLLPFYLMFVNGTRTSNEVKSGISFWFGSNLLENLHNFDLKQRGLLAGDTAVSTVMANLGLTHALRDAGINLIQTKVGDRYVLEAMREGGYVIGGEQSGHTIFLEHNSTGDGLVTALQFLAACKRAGKSAGEAAKAMTRFPQTLINVRVKDKHAADGNQAIADAVAAAEAALGEDGRVLLRPSGTEPVVRVMVEAMDEQAAEQHAKAIAEVVEREI